jgi:hypothetical protein
MLRTPDRRNAAMMRSSAVSLFDRFRRLLPAKQFQRVGEFQRTSSPDFWEKLASHPDALAMLVAMRSDPEGRYSTNLGVWAPANVPAVAGPNTHTLVLGPSQSAAGKTSGYMIPVVLTEGGPVVVSSTKFDIARNTAMARSRLGTVWHYDPTGAPAPPGFKELTWSPVPNSKDWNGALEIARQMVSASDAESQNRGRSDNARFFEERAADLIACLLHHAALTGKDIRHVVGRISAMDLKNEIGPIVHELRELGSEQASQKLRGLVFGDPRTVTDVFSSADVALRGYQGSALNSAAKVNFDPNDFVLGSPVLPSDLSLDGEVLLRGRYDTVYITVPADKQRLYSPLVIGLLSAIKKAVYDKHQWEERNDQTGTRQPVTFVLDEMYGSPLPELPALLSEGGGQGLLICGALQDLSQATARWGDVGHGFLTLWQNVLVLPGIRDRATLELLSMLIGDKDRHIQTESWGEQSVSYPSGIPQREWFQSRSEHIDRVPRLPPDVIYRGNQYDPAQVLHFSPNGGWGWVRLLKYWQHQPWPGILLQSANHVLDGDEENCALPLPNLARGGDYRALRDVGGEDMARWFWHLQQTWQSKQRPSLEVS